jgi:diketogulonate reductase-like aldo/keto reductase
MIRPSDTVMLGRTGLRVTRLGLGMRPLGLLPVGQEATGRAIILGAVRLGIRFLDTAPVYGYGESECRLGEVWAHLPPLWSSRRRSDWFLKWNRSSDGLVKCGSTEHPRLTTRAGPFAGFDG